MNCTKVRTEDIAADFFKEHPNEEIEVAYAEDKIKKLYFDATGDVVRDPARVVRFLYETEFLKRVRKGVYKYDPTTSSNKTYLGTESVAKTSKKKKIPTFDRKVIELCFEKAKTEKDENAKKCFEKILNTLYKHEISTY